MKTFSPKPSDITKKWWLIDAKDLVLGRLASEIAKLIRGKHKPFFSPHMDSGDYVVVINAEKIHMTGQKRLQKTYYRHTGYPGGIKSNDANTILSSRFPERVLMKAVERMISRNPLGRQQMTKLHIYSGSDHPHQGQSPEPFDLASKNSKNTKRV